MFYFIATDTGERFSTFTGFSVLGSYTRYMTPFEARCAFHKSSYRAGAADPIYFIRDEKTGKVVEQIQLFEVKR